MNISRKFSCKKVLDKGTYHLGGGELVFVFCSRSGSSSGNHMHIQKFFIAQGYRFGVGRGLRK